MDIFQFIRKCLDTRSQSGKGRFIRRSLFQTPVDFIELFCHTFLPLSALKGIESRPESFLDMLRMRGFVDSFFQLFIFLFLELGPFDFLNLEIEDTQETCFFPLVFLQLLRFPAQIAPV